MYYMTEFGSLKKMEGESVSDFSKRFNKMYNKIPIEIIPLEASAKISYASAFDLDLCLLLRERRATSLAQMQDATIEVESNVLAADRLRNKADADRRKGRFEASASSPSMAHPQVDELTKMVKSLSVEMEKMKVEGRQAYKGPQTTKNKGGFRRPNNFTPPNVQRERGRDKEDQKNQAPFQNNFVAKGEEGETYELGPKIHCFGDTPSFPHLNQSSYEESLMDSQLNELSKGDKATNNQGRYDLRSKKKTATPDAPERSTRIEEPANEVADSHRGKRHQPLSPIVQSHVPKIREIPKLASSFNFEHEIQKIRIPMPLTELIKHEGFKKRFSRILQFETSCLPIDSINFQDEKPTVILGPMVEDRNDASPPFYTFLNIHDKVLYNCLMDSELLTTSCKKLSWKS
jgi:hypothetical protein